jgi:hypothetical protein
MKRFIDWIKGNNKEGFKISFRNSDTGEFPIRVALVPYSGDEISGDVQFLNPWEETVLPLGGLYSAEIVYPSSGIENWKIELPCNLEEAPVISKGEPI